MAKFRDFLEKENVNENATAGSVGAGSIASGPASIGNKSRYGKVGKKKKTPETIFAMSNEEEGDDNDRNPDPVKDRHWKGHRKLSRIKKRKIGPNDLPEGVEDEITIIRRRAGIID